MPRPAASELHDAGGVDVAKDRQVVLKVNDGPHLPERLDAHQDGTLSLFQCMDLHLPRNSSCVHLQAGGAEAAVLRGVSKGEHWRGGVVHALEPIGASFGSVALHHSLHGSCRPNCLSRSSIDHCHAAAHGLGGGQTKVSLFCTKGGVAARLADKAGHSITVAHKWCLLVLRAIGLSQVGLALLFPQWLVWTIGHSVALRPTSEALNLGIIPGFARRC